MIWCMYMYVGVRDREVDKRVASVRFCISGRKSLTVVCAYAPNISSEYSYFLEKLEEVEEPPSDSLVLLC